MTVTEKYFNQGIDLESMSFEDITDLLSDNYGEFYYVGQNETYVRFFYDDGAESISYTEALTLIKTVFDNLKHNAIMNICKIKQ
jgi:hypothetical protein